MSAVDHASASAAVRAVAAARRVDPDGELRWRGSTMAARRADTPKA